MTRFPVPSTLFNDPFSPIGYTVVESQIERQFVVLIQLDAPFHNRKGSSPDAATTSCGVNRFPRIQVTFRRHCSLEFPLAP